MTREYPTLLLDTNIWMDNYFSNRPESAAARELIAYANEQNYTLAYATTSAKDLFFLAGSELKRIVRQQEGELSESSARACSEMAWAFLKNMTAIAVAAPVGEPQIWLATHYRDLHEDFEDDLILAAAEESRADFLVTGDRDLFGKSAVPTFMSADMLAYLKK